MENNKVVLMVVTICSCALRSVLCSFLFLIDTKDITANVTFETFLFADDSSLYTIAIHINIIIITMTKWLTDKTTDSADKFTVLCLPCSV